MAANSGELMGTTPSMRPNLHMTLEANIGDNS